MRVLIVVLLAALTGCGTIDRYETAVQPLGQTLVAGVGDVILRVEKTRDLTNVVGKADVWGRKTSEGHIEVRFMGVEPDGTLLFARKDVEIVSNETTVTRMGFVPLPTVTRSTTNGYVGSTAISGTTNSSGTTFVPTPAAQSIVIPPDMIPIRLAPGKQTFRVTKTQIQVIEASGHEVSYRLVAQP